MRLYQPFIRLPVTFDAPAVAAELTALDESVWRDHPEGAPGNSAVPLLAVGGDPFDDGPRGPMLPTPYLDALPYTRQLLVALESPIGRSRLMRIEEEGELVEHVDTNYYWRDHLRVHFPVVTQSSVHFECGDVGVHMGEGEVWVFDTWRRHRVLNPAQTARIHLVVDTVGGPALWDLIDDPTRPTVHVAPRAESRLSPLSTEAVNDAVVMTPWEVDQTIEAIVADLSLVAPELAARGATDLRPWQRAWRAEWARSGDTAAGWGRFAELCVRGGTIAQEVFGDALLPNQMAVVDAIRQHVLRPAMRAGTTSGAPSPASSSTHGSGSARLDRPVFVVSSPRAGSSLLFETLARAPDVSTIGGESHLLIESITELHPSAHGWESNRLVAADATAETVAEVVQAFTEELRDRDGAAPHGGPIRMLEKTPKNSLRVPFLAAAFPGARFVYLYRDPRETVSSMLDAWRSGRFVTYPNLPGWSGDRWSLLLVPGWRELDGLPLAQVVARQWATATTVLLDDLADLDPDRWCVASYDRLVGDPRAEIERLRTFCELAWDVELTSGALPLSRHTLDSPHPDKWRRNADELEPYWEPVRAVAARAHDVFAAPPRIRPIRRALSPDASRAASPPATSATPVAPDEGPDAAESVSFESVHTSSVPAILDLVDTSLFVSTYQSGRVIVVRVNENGLNTHFRGFETPMGMAARPGELAIGTKTQVHRFQNQPALSARLEPPGLHDAVFAPRDAHSTGDIRIHDLGYAGNELWAVNTRFSCLCTFDNDHSFVPRWRPPFVSALAAEDRCHLNGMAIVEGEPRYVTALGTSDSEGGWREHKTDGGVLMHVPSGEVVVSGLCMPHSPRWHEGTLFLLESGNGGIGTVDVETGRYWEITRVPGFTRGLAFAGSFAFVGLSQVRESLFEGIPLRAEGVERSCGVWIIDLSTGNTAGFLRFEGIVQELFEVLALPGVRFPEIVEPGSELVESAFVVPDEALADVPDTARS